MSDVVNDLRNHLAGAVNLHPAVNVRAVAVYTIEQAIAEIERLRGQRDAIRALMAAAKALQRYHHPPSRIDAQDCPCCNCEGERAMAGLRAASILEGEPND